MPLLKLFCGLCPPRATPPEVLKYTPSTVPVVQLVMSSKSLSMEDVTDIAQNHLKSQLAIIRGAQVPMPIGGKAKQIVIDLNNQSLETYGLTAMEVVNKVASANLKRAVEMQNYEYIKAPFDGVVTKYNLDTGANVVAGGSSTSTMLFEISQIVKLRLRIDIPQSYIDRVKLNQKISFFVPETPEKTYVGTLLKLSKSFDNLTRTMKAEITVNNKDLGLFAGQYVKTVIPFENKNKMLLIKNSSLVTNKDGTRVLTVDNDGVLHFKNIVIEKDFGDVVEIKDGLIENDKIVVNYNDNLTDGQKVLCKEAQKTEK